MAFGKNSKYAGQHDSWPRPTSSWSRERLTHYEVRLEKEAIAFLNKTKHVIPGHEGHPAFIQRRLKQVRSLLHQS
jgi:hypothetical protein